MRVKIIFIPVLLLIAAYSFFWYWLADQAKQETLDWIENSENRMEGIKAFVGDVSVSGFPYKIIIEASSLNLLIPEGKVSTDEMSINFPEVAVVYQPWKPNHAIVVADYFDAVIGPLQAPVKTISFDKVKSSLIFDPSSSELNNLSAVADKITWTTGFLDESQEKSKIDLAEFHLRRSRGNNQQQESYDLPVNRAIFIKGSNAVINEFKGTLLGPNADQFKIEAMLHANKQPQFTKESLSEWRDAGGTVGIRTFEYGTDQSGINLSGDVTLDENFKPLGAFDATVSGLPQILMSLSENEEFPETTRMLLRTQAQSNSMPEETPLSLSLQNGQLYLGPIMLMELPAVIE